MAEPLKNIYNEAFLEQFAQKINESFPLFPSDKFTSSVLDDQWEELALKARMRKITYSLGRFLPEAYEEAIQILLHVNKFCVGFPYLILPDFVEVYGQDEEHWDLSMEALEQFTAHSSAEFAVRPFIIKHPKRMMKQMKLWSQNPNEHVRRLASEGCRPRLPWGQALVLFKNDPTPIIEVLELLQADPSLYVRKSVANNLNDIAKDHPELVVAIAKRWLGKDPLTDWIVRHGCRTLIRKAVPEVLSLFGYADNTAQTVLIEEAQLAVQPSTVFIGGECQLQYKLHIRQGDPVRLRIEYGIDFVKASGKVSRKKFLLSDKTVEGGSVLEGVRTHRWSDLTTRRHYPGLHHILLIVNGEEAASAEMMLEQLVNV